MIFDVFLPETYNLVDSSVIFNTTDKHLKELYDKAEAICKANIKTFSDYSVLIEGAKYNGVWLETQPMGGEMYAKRNLKVALSNTLIFLRYQRKDGRFPGMIKNQGKWEGVSAHYDWLQGFFLPHAALKLYFYTGRNKQYLELLYECLEDFNAYLWKYRDSDNNGCLESWCIWDTGEDNCTIHMLNGLKVSEHGAWGKSIPPEDYGNMPYESPQIMSYSYACCDVLSRISEILENGKVDFWREKAKEIQKKFIEYLWDEENKYCFQRDKHNQKIEVLTQENIKCMYSGIFTQNMADAFIKKHLLNENEFWTPYPLPSIAANEMYFHVNSECSNCAKELKKMGTAGHDIDDNSWSGPSHGLNYQRSIQAMINYNHHAENIMIGKKLIELIKKTNVFVQQYNPYTAEISKAADDGYGPTTLAFLEYVSLLYGINIEYNRIFWTAILNKHNFEYTQNMCGNKYVIKCKDNWIVASINDEIIFECCAGLRVITDLEGNIISVFGIEEQTISAVCKLNQNTYKFDVSQNQEYCMQNGNFILVNEV